MGSLEEQAPFVEWRDEHQQALDKRIAEFRARLQHYLRQNFLNALGDPQVHIVGRRDGGDTMVLFLLNPVAMKNRRQIERDLQGRHGAEVIEVQALVAGSDGNDHLEECPTLAVQFYLGPVDPTVRRSWKNWMRLIAYVSLALVSLTLLYWTIVPPVRNPMNSAAAVAFQTTASSHSHSFHVDLDQLAPLQITEPPKLHRPRPARDP